MHAATCAGAADGPIERASARLWTANFGQSLKWERRPRRLRCGALLFFLWWFFFFIRHFFSVLLFPFLVSARRYLRRRGAHLPSMRSPFPVIEHHHPCLLPDHPMLGPRTLLEYETPRHARNSNLHPQYELYITHVFSEPKSLLWKSRPTACARIHSHHRNPPTAWMWQSARLMETFATCLDTDPCIALRPPAPVRRSLFG